MYSWKNGKETVSPSESHASSLLELIHTDVCEVNLTSISKVRYFITYLDDYSRKISIYFLHKKDQVAQTLQHFINFAENQSSCKVKTIRSDNGTEYVNAAVKQICDKHGILHQTSVAYNPSQNGRAERLNRTLLDKMRTLIAAGQLNQSFWPEALSTAAYLSNHSAHRFLNGKLPQEVWTGRTPSLKHLRTFGCRALAYIEPHKRSKLDSRAKECLMLGYSETQKGYRLWDIKDSKIIISRDVEFFEKDESNTKSITTFLPNEDNEEGSEEENEVQPVFQDMDLDETNEPTKDDKKKDPSASDRSSWASNNRPYRERKPPSYLDDYALYAMNTYSLEPATYEEAINGPKKQQWMSAMKKEYDSIIKNGTWDLCDLPDGQGVVGSKWVYKTKNTSRLLHML